MKINVNNLNLNEFNAIIKDDKVLVFPKKSKFKWENNELHLRSLLCYDDGTVISAGFPKFFNFNEKEKYHRNICSRASFIIAQEKLDGTLVIASMIEGKLHLRTRGSHDLGLFTDDVLKTIKDNEYDKQLEFLLKKMNNGEISNNSILLEYTSPTNQIVVRYPKPNLTILGAVNFQNELTVRSALDIHTLIPKPKFRYLKTPVSSKGFEPSAFADEVSKQKNQEEGYVLYVIGDETRLVKFKTDWYMRLHAMISGLGNISAKEMLLTNNLYSIERFVEFFSKNGFDWESAEYVLDNNGIRSIIEECRKKIKDCEIAVEKGKLLKKKLDQNKLTRKEAALEIKKEIDESLRPVLFAALDDNEQNAVLSYVTGIKPQTVGMMSEKLPSLKELIKENKIK